MLYSEEQIQRANERSISEYFRQAGIPASVSDPKHTLKASAVFM